MDHFDDHLPIYDDLNDLIDLQPDELNRYFLEGQLVTITKEEEIIEDACLISQKDLKVKTFLLY